MKHLALLRPTSIVLLLALGAATPALAQTWMQSLVVVEAKHFVVGVNDPFSDDDLQEMQGSVPYGLVTATADSDHDPAVFHGSASAWSQVAVGGVHVYARGLSVASGPELLRVTSGAQASGFMSDFFSLAVPGAASGAIFSVSALVRVDGLAAATVLPRESQYGVELAAFSHWESWVRVLDGASGSSLAELRAWEDCAERASSNAGFSSSCASDGQTGSQIITFSMSNNGSPVQLDMRGWVSAGTSVYQPQSLVSADSVADLGHTIAWEGIVELRDADGHVVTDYAALSATSGFDYRNAYVAAVPEPSGGLLLLAGLAAVAAVVRRRARKACTMVAERSTRTAR